MTTETSRAFGLVEHVEAGLAAIGDDRGVPELGQRRLDKPALHRIVIDYEYGTCHDCLSFPPEKIPMDHLGTGF
ncbi:hypothetical protein ACVOMV_00425 [Mesorhizobium atlanticum]